MNQKIAYLTILRKEVRRFALVYRQALISPLLTTTLYFLIFGTFIGSRIGKMDGYSYLEFIIPGLILMPVISSAFSHVVFSIYLSRYQNTINDLIVSPVKNSTIIFGHVTGGVLRCMIVAFLVYLVSLFFSPLIPLNPLTLVLSVLLTSIVFALLGFIVGLLARDFDDTSTLSTFVITPLTYLGGVFYSIKDLPETWQFISKFNPILYMINGFRYSFLGVSDVDISLSLLAMLIVAIVLYMITLNMMKKGIGIRE